MLVKQTNITPHNDPWECLPRRLTSSEHLLTSIEFTVTNLCNLRCEHCAVGDALTTSEAKERIPLASLLGRLDEIEHLDTLSITGGEPMFNKEMIAEYILPILRYAHERGTQTQLNSNLTLDLERYEAILPFLDVLHISINYADALDFHRTAYVHTQQEVAYSQAEKTFQRMLDNTQTLTKAGLFVSAESLISHYTKDKLGKMNRMIKELGCQRHEVHPMYPSDFARHLQVLTLEELRAAYHQLLDEREPDLWVLFGTLPFYACSNLPEDLALIKRLQTTPNVTVRNDPDGHNRLNCNIFNGDVIVTDFGDIKPLGNVHEDTFQACFDRWQEHPMNQPFRCYCPQSRCVGPNILVADTYYRGLDFRQRQGIDIDVAMKK